MCATIFFIYQGEIMNTIKNLLVVFALLAPGIVSAENTFLAPNTVVKSVENVDMNQTKLTLTYDLPCWAEYVDTVSKTVILGDVMNPASDFEIVVGVLLRGDLMNPCVGTQKKDASLTLNTNAVEGNFKGFKVIENP